MEELVPNTISIISASVHLDSVERCVRKVSVHQIVRRMEAFVWKQVESTFVVVHVGLYTNTIVAVYLQINIPKAKTPIILETKCPIIIEAKTPIMELGGLLLVLE
jgi:hypothetical protein